MQEKPPTDPRPDPPAGSVSARWDRETERRYAALELAIRSTEGGTREPAEITVVAEEFFQFLTKGRTPSTWQPRPEEDHP
jgi:hypothetical protein